MVYIIMTHLSRAYMILSLFILSLKYACTVLKSIYGKLIIYINVISVETSM